MSTTELRVMLAGKQIQSMVNPSFCPPQGSYLKVPMEVNGVTRLKEVFVSKISTSYPKPGDPVQITIVLCECVET